jgi:hypothetical protein
MIDFSPILDAGYAVFAANASLTPLAGSPVSIDAIDQTEGAEVSDSDNALLISIKPVAVVQGADLVAAGIDPAALDNGTITLNIGDPAQKTWRIVAHKLRPMGAGELSGDVQLILIEG